MRCCGRRSYGTGNGSRSWWCRGDGEEVKVGRNRRVGLLGEGKRAFVKSDMTRDDYAVCREIKTAVTAVISRVSEEDT